MPPLCCTAWIDSVLHLARSLADSVCQGLGWVRHPGILLQVSSMGMLCQHVSQALSGCCPPQVTDRLCCFVFRLPAVL